MSGALKAFELKSRVPATVAALVLFSGIALFFFVPGSALLGVPLAWVGGVLSTGMVALAGLGLANLLRHEGWAVVLADSAVELPTAPYRSSRRDRLPYAEIELITVSPSPPAAPDVLLIHPTGNRPARWVRQADLRSGAVREVAQQLAERVTAVRGAGQVVRVEYH